MTTPGSVPEERSSMFAMPRIVMLIDGGKASTTGYHDGHIAFAFRYQIPGRKQV